MAPSDENPLPVQAFRHAPLASTEHLTHASSLRPMAAARSRTSPEHARHVVDGRDVGAIIDEALEEAVSKSAAFDDHIFALSSSTRAFKRPKTVRMAGHFVTRDAQDLDEG